MLAYVVRRVIAVVPIVLFVGILVFFLIHLTPGDPAAVMLGDSATASDVARLRAELGLDEPVIEQFFDWIKNVASGNLGASVFSGQPVLSDIRQHVAPTLSLAVTGLVIGVGVAVPTAMVAVWKRKTILDPVFMSISIFGISVPGFWLALILILLVSVKLQILPVSGYAPLSDGFGPWLTHIILPACVLAAEQAAQISRMLRDGMLDVLGEDYIRTARAKGLSERIVLGKHALANAIIPTVTVIGVSVAQLLSGAVVVEQIFVMPGLGNLLIDSIQQRDFPVIQGEVLLIALVYVAVNLMTDLIYGLLDPRIRYN